MRVKYVEKYCDERWISVNLLGIKIEGGNCLCEKSMKKWKEMHVVLEQL